METPQNNQTDPAPKKNFLWVIVISASALVLILILGFLAYFFLVIKKSNIEIPAPVSQPIPDELQSRTVTQAQLETPVPINNTIEFNTNEKCRKNYDNSFRPDNFYLREKARLAPISLYALNSSDYCWMTEPDGLGLDNIYTLSDSFGEIEYQNQKIKIGIKETNKGYMNSGTKDDLLYSYKTLTRGESLPEGAPIEEVDLTSGDRNGKMIVIYPHRIEKTAPSPTSFFETNIIPRAYALSIATPISHGALIFWNPDEKTDIFISLEPLPDIKSPEFKELEVDFFKGLGEKMLQDMQIVVPNSADYAEKTCQKTGGRWGNNNLLDVQQSRCPAKRFIKEETEFSTYHSNPDSMSKYVVDCVCPANKCLDVYGNGGCVDYSKTDGYANEEKNFKKREARCTEAGGKMTIANKSASFNYPFRYTGWYCQCQNNQLISYSECEDPAEGKCFDKDLLKNNCESSGGAWLGRRDSIDFQIGNKEMPGFSASTENCNKGIDKFPKYELQGPSPQHSTTCAGEESSESFQCFCKEGQCLDWGTAKCQEIPKEEEEEGVVEEDE